MKKMKKLITLLISLTMIFALCACGQTAEPKTEEPAKTDAPAADVAAADEPVTLRLYTRYSDEDNIKRIDYAVEKLKEEYPNVTIEIEAMPADDGVALKAMAATGDMPDIFSLSGTDLIASLAQYGAIKDMTPLLEANGFLDKVIESEKVKVFFTDGNAYCLPFTGTEMANFFANTEIFQNYGLEIPQTIDELVECAKVFSANGMCTLPVFASEAWITNAFFNAILTRYDNRGLDALYSGEASIHDDAYKKINPGEIMVTYGNLHRGFLYPMLKFAVITESDIFGVKKKKKEKKSHYQGQRISDFAQLKPGDYVVHENYGLGIYRGTERQIVDKVTKDYIKIEYGDGGKLYFPVTQLHMIQKYADSESKQPKLNKLNGQE